MIFVEKSANAHLGKTRFLDTLYVLFCVNKVLMFVIFDSTYFNFRPSDHSLRTSWNRFETPA